MCQTCQIPKSIDLLKKYAKHQRLLPYSVKNFGPDCDLIKKIIIRCYESKTESIADFSQVVDFINKICYSVIAAPIFSKVHVDYMLSLRKQAKRYIRIKYQAAKIGQKFAYSNNSYAHYRDFIANVWKPAIPILETAISYFRCRV